MSWLDDYQQGSFRGVSFKVSSHEGTSGRRDQVTEFPGRDNPYIQDHGQKPRRFTIDAYVIGDSYHIDRNKLIKALDRKGPGKLIHPYMGDFQVVITDYSYRDTVREGGMCRFTITCIVSSDLKLPTKTIDTIKKVAEAKENAFFAYQELFEEIWKISRVPKTVADSALDTIDRAFALMESDKSAVSFLASFRRDIKNVRGRLIAVAYDTSSLIGYTLDLMRLGTDEDNEEIDVTSSVSRQSFEDLKSFTNFEPSDIINQKDDEPSKVYSETIQYSAIINMAGLLSLIEFESAETAEDFRNLVFIRLDQIMESTPDDEFYNALYELRSTVSQHIDEQVRELPRRVKYVPIETTAALLISYNIYGTVSKEQKIIERNKISHPAFINGSVPLEILTNAE